MISCQIWMIVVAVMKTESNYDINEDNENGVTCEDPVRNENNVKHYLTFKLKILNHYVMSSKRITNNN